MRVIAGKVQVSSLCGMEASSPGQAQLDSMYAPRKISRAAGENTLFGMTMRLEQVGGRGVCPYIKSKKRRMHDPALAILQQRFTARQRGQCRSHKFSPRRLKG